MMSVRAERAERLAEILREIFALSEINQSNHSRSAALDDSIKLLDTQSASRIDQTCVPHGRQASEKRSEPEDQDCLR
jgi:hypothetical protein